MSGVRYRVTWRDPWDRDGQHLVGDGMDVDAFVEGLAAGAARDICVYPMAPESEPWTFGDLEIGDLFMFGERGPYVVTRDYSWMNCVGLDGKTARFDRDDPVEPFTLEWSE